MSDYLKINKANWDERADIHMSDPNDWYGVQKFLAGEDVRGPIETQEMGDLSGLKILHMQCHFGLDTLSVARHARQVIGVDLSSTALTHARDLAARSGLTDRTSFLEADVYSSAALLDSDFDMAFATWGATCWLPDIAKWAEVMAAALKPGGTLYYLDCHPFAATLEELGEVLVPTYAYGTPESEPLVFESLQSYNESKTPMKATKSVEWIHRLSDVFAGLRGAGLQIEMFNEHSAVPWEIFKFARRDDDGMYRLPSPHDNVPLAYSFRARKLA